MEKLTSGQKLHLTRIGRCLTLSEVARKLFLSPSYISLLESDDRKLPVEINDILDLKNGIKWYTFIIGALSKEPVSEDDINESIEILDRVLRIVKPKSNIKI